MDMANVPLAKGGVTPEEQQLQDALNHLDLLLARCRDMRTTIPEMVINLQQISKRGNAPEASFADFANSIKEPINKIQKFTKLYTSEESQKVFNQAWKSVEANPKGIKPLPQ
ncbi:hypothetical protein F5Y17DRAFT_434383 [Xylariaceae sp. FL0594]|nr:hypothetical protein F5Y17DRAFT_434383 [Xylariaceae sp. FL0594]